MFSAGIWSSSLEGDFAITDVEYRKASVVGNEIIFTGGLGDIQDERRVFKFNNQGIFTPGPELPERMNNHCQLTINETHIFVGGYPTPGAFLLDLSTEEYVIIS